MIYAVVKVVRRADRVTRVSDIPKNSSLLHESSRLNIGESVQVSVVVPLPAGTKDANNVTAETVFANLEDHTVGCAQHWATKRREDVDAFVTSIVAPGSAPRVFQLP